MNCQLHHGDCLEVMRTMPDESIQCCVTSPPYWGLRDYGVDGQLGLEPTPEEYVSKMVAVFAEVKRVLAKDGTLWLNLGDSYTSSTKGIGGVSKKQARNTGSRYSFTCVPNTKPKDLVGIPWRVAFALQADGWYLRQDIIWHKPNPMPESVTDRCTKAHEYIFLLSKSVKYYYDNDAIKETATGKSKAFNGSNTFKSGAGGNRNDGGRCSVGNIIEKCNKRSVWTVNTQPFPEAHFATFPEKLIEPCIFAGCPEDGTVLDPFCGSGTTGIVSLKAQRRFIGIELNKEYYQMAKSRIGDTMPLFA